jgi:Cytochrome c554 and c-prime
LQARIKNEIPGIHAEAGQIGRQPRYPGSHPVRRTIYRRLVLVALAPVLSMHPGTAAGQLSTQDHLAEPGFWPTQDQPSRAGFAGPESCARCHVSKASQAETPMAQNMTPAASADILHAHPALTFSANKFEYRLETGANKAIYSVAGRGQRLSFPLAWAFGTGRVAQSYLFKKGDGFYEARASYFTNLKTLDFTPGRAIVSPSGIVEAMYRPVGEAEVQRCFACHATAANIGGQFDEKHLIPGVTCEACHGPGASHASAMDHRTGNESAGAKGSIFDPGDLLPADAVDFCGACHSSFWDVKLSGGKGASTTRSAPYRLVTSKCWGTGDARLTCTACHDPHKQLETTASAYDPICRSCHVSKPGEKATASHPGAACPKAMNNCTDCHMQRVYVPEMHANFTDHRIRIAHPGEAFPE